MSAADVVASGRAVLGVELGSTRIKGVLIGPDHVPLAAGSHEWENELVDGRWTYSLDAVWEGLRACTAAVLADVRDRHGVELRSLAGLGVSAMMHGYLPLDDDGELLVPFRTWRNTSTGPASEQLSRELGRNVPHRWSVAHLHQALLDGEPHVPHVAHLTTLAGLVHERLGGHRVLGVGDASGVFPIDPVTRTYDADLLARYDRLAADAGATRPLLDLLPPVLVSGDDAGRLSADGAALLDPTGVLQPGALLCPPEGDAGTGMVATNSVAPRTGNVSAGTSVFAMVVLERDLRRAHHAIDLVTTPDGRPVAMVHCNNGASELDAWAGVFAEFAALLGSDADGTRVFEVLLRSALEGAPDAAGLMVSNYLSGEPVTGVAEGRPLVVRTPGSRLDLGTFVRAQLLALFATLRIGMDVLLDEEGVRLDRLLAHGGLFRTAGVAQGVLAAALDTPVSVGAAASEGGAWGIAVLAAFAVAGGGDLAGYLDDVVFRDAEVDTVAPDPDDVAAFARFVERFRAALPLQTAAAAVT
ncbi:FGGY-family carbohydrate kinase [Angustibacter aerolatus]